MKSHTFRTISILWIDLLLWWWLNHLISISLMRYGISDCSNNIYIFYSTIISYKPKQLDISLPRVTITSFEESCCTVKNVTRMTCSFFSISAKSDNIYFSCSIHISRVNNSASAEGVFNLNIVAVMYMYSFASLQLMRLFNEWHFTSYDLKKVSLNDKKWIQ